MNVLVHVTLQPFYASFYLKEGINSLSHVRTYSTISVKAKHAIASISIWLNVQYNVKLKPSCNLPHFLFCLPHLIFTASFAYGLFISDVLRSPENSRKTPRTLNAWCALFLQDNAPEHTSQVAVAAANDCGFTLLSHPPYSPDLAPQWLPSVSKFEKIS